LKVKQAFLQLFKTLRCASLWQHTMSSIASLYFTNFLRFQSLIKSIKYGFYNSSATLLRNRRQGKPVNTAAE